MVVSEPFEQSSVLVPAWAVWARNGCLWLLITILAWSPFPLGSNREWSWSILTILVAISWLFLAVWSSAIPETQWRNLEWLKIPLVLAGLALVWAFLQAVSTVPLSWVHPIWGEASSLIERPVEGIISINPWRTISEVTKLATYLAVALIAFSLCRNADRARQCLNAIMVSGAAYAIYAFVLGILRTNQYSLFYFPPTHDQSVTGPFVLHNSFATFEGLSAIAALARLLELADGEIVASKGLRRWTMSALQFAFGSASWVVVVVILTISGLVASASRAGAFSTLCALFAMTLPFVSLLKHRASRRWALTGAGSVISLLLVLVWINGDTLTDRLQDLIDAGNADPIRIALWSAAQRMITSAPFLGLGLGTFQDAYPMYANQVLPFIMDKAHSDYLEFAAGVGLPAAFSWWLAILWAMIQMVRGVLYRNRDRIYPLVGFGASVLVVVHSTVDFSLQIPAVAVTYAAMLGLGLAQSQSSKKN